MLMQKEISPQIKRLFWDADTNMLDVDIHAKTIIERVLNNGTLADWRWLVATYGSRQLHSVMDMNDRFGRSNLRPASRRIASLLLPT